MWLINSFDKAAYYTILLEESLQKKNIVLGPFQVLFLFTILGQVDASSPCVFRENFADFGDLCFLKCI
jgi:hypothetical protein